MNGSEFSRSVRLDVLGAVPRVEHITADASEREALVERFSLLALDTLSAEVRMTRGGDVVEATGRITASVSQACVVTGDAVPALVNEPFTLRFVPEAMLAGDEIELGEDDLDILGHGGDAIDIGEAVAQGLALALDPFPRSPAAGAALTAAGVLNEEQAEEARRQTSPFAALKALRPG